MEQLKIVETLILGLHIISQAQSLCFFFVEGRKWLVLLAFIHYLLTLPVQNTLCPFS